jgi:predicted nuclease of restriction endonuclease-like (RecB) superfamily
MVIVNSAMIMTYYEIGTIINQRKTWGRKYIQKLSEDLKEYGKGYSYTNLKRMSLFASNFSYNEISPQIVGHIPWGTIDYIMSKSKSHEEMLWYINQTHKNGWSRSTVLKQFESKAYERGIIDPVTTPSIKNDGIINELFKDTYVFDFLNDKNTKTHEELKNSMLDNIVSFIKELGPYFTLIDKEFKIITPTNKGFYIDLLMYHVKLHVYIVIELKNREFKPEDLGQHLFYVNAVNDLEKTELDNETVGLLLCKDADNYVAKTTLNGIDKKIGISKYKILEELPSYLEKRLKE